MTVDELKSAQLKLEDDIFELLKNFRLHTGVNVIDLRLDLIEITKIEDKRPEFAVVVHTDLGM